MWSSRRRFLSVCGGLGTLATAGCLRLSQGSDDQSSTETERKSPERTAIETEPQSDDAGSTSNSVRLDRTWRLSDLSGSSSSSNVVAWPYGNSVLVGRTQREPDFLRRVSADGTEVWRGADVPQSHTVYRSSIATSDEHVVVGFPGEGNGTLQPDNATDEGALIHCYDSDSGELRWQTMMHPETYFVSSVGIDEGGVVTVATDARGAAGINLYGLDAASGEQLWRRSELPVDDTVDRTTDSVTNGPRFVIASFWGLFALDTSSGAVTDEYRSPDTPYFDLSLDDGDIYGTDTATAVRFDLDSFSGQWETELVGSGERNCEVGNDAVFVNDRDSYVYSFERETGSQRWRQRVDGGVVDLALTDEHLWVSDTTGAVRGYARESGEVASEPMTVTTKSSAAGEVVPLVGIDETLFVGGEEPGQFEVVTV